MNEELYVFLEHHGVKGMKWGVINEDRNPQNTSYSTVLTKSAKSFTPEEKTKNQIAMNSISQQKAEPPGFSLRNLTPNQKKALYIGLGVTAAAAIVGTGFYLKSKGISINPKNLSPRDLYYKQVFDAQANIWGNLRHIHPSSFERPEMIIPKGQLFTRISLGPETAFKNYTYASFKPDDVARYTANFGASLAEYAEQKLNPETLTGSHRINFSATGDIKVPSLSNALDILKESISTRENRTPSTQEVMDLYSFFTKDNWKGPKVESFFAALKAKGYSALVDDLDAGVMADNPLIFFNHEVLTSKTSTPLTNQMVEEARKLIKPLEHLKT